jgi:hypothetical protein
MLSAEEMKAHYSSVRKRLMGGAPKVAVPPKPPAPVGLAPIEPPQSRLADYGWPSRLPNDDRVKRVEQYNQAVQNVLDHHRAVRDRLEQQLAEATADANRKLADLREAEGDTMPTAMRRPILEIAQEIADFYDVTMVELCSERRTGIIVEARHACFYAVSAERPDMSLPEIGRRLGGRDHTTVLHGIRRHAERHGLPLPGRHKTAPIYTTTGRGWKRVLNTPMVE